MKHFNLKDLEGETFGKWKVIKMGGRNKSGNVMWECICECGVKRDVNGASLRKGTSTSCGNCSRNRAIDMKGRQFGNWTVIERHEENSCGQVMWKCVCACGTERIVNGSTLRNGASESCGCKYAGTQHTTHGMSGTRFYEIWASMLGRCKLKTKTAYKHYGGRGITVCERWEEFTNFYDDMYESYQEHLEIHGEKNTTLDRIDVDGNYEPSNVRWATWSEQNSNKRLHKQQL